MGLALITAPTVEPVSIDEVKRWAKIDDTTDDQIVRGLIKSVRRTAEKGTGLAILTQTWDLTLDAFPPWEIRIPKPPLVSITHVKYYDTNGTLQTLSSTLYTVTIDRKPGIIEPSYGNEWPTTRDQTAAVVIRFVAGYTDADAVPDDLKTAIKTGCFWQEMNRASIEQRDIGNLFQDFWVGDFDPET